jgi:hypothetical protein
VENSYGHAHAITQKKHPTPPNSALRLPQRTKDQKASAGKDCRIYTRSAVTDSLLSHWQVIEVSLEKLRETPDKKFNPRLVFVAVEIRIGVITYV